MKIDRRRVLTAAAGFPMLSIASACTTAGSTTISGRSQPQIVLENYIDQHRADWSIPGVIAVITGPGDIGASIYSGFANTDARLAVNEDHLFQIGSVSKLMVALTLWSQQEEGILSLSDPISDWLPNIPIKSGAAITIQHLLDHRSGLPGNASPYYEGGLWTGFAPGRRYAYSNLGYVLAGMIAAQADGLPYSEVVQKRVLTPLGMHASKGAINSADRPLYATGYQPLQLDRPWVRPGPIAPAPWLDFEGPSGCVASTAYDMGKFLKFLNGLTKGEGGALFSNAAALEFMTTPVPVPGAPEGVTYRNGLNSRMIDGRRVFYHGGGMVSFTSHLHIDHDTGIAAFASANLHAATTHRPSNVTQYACDLYAAHIKRAPIPAPPPTSPQFDADGAMEGSFYARSGEKIELVLSPDEQVLKRGSQRMALQPRGNGFYASSNPSLAETGLQTAMSDGQITQVWIGAEEFLIDPKIGFSQHSRDVLACAGVYSNHDKWSVPFRVLPRGDSLIAMIGNYTQKLSKRQNGDWVFGDKETATDWIRFETLANGKYQRLRTPNGVHIRRSE